MANRVIKLAYNPIAVAVCEECGARDEGDPGRVMQRARRHAKQKRHTVIVDKIAKVAYEGIGE